MFVILASLLAGGLGLGWLVMDRSRKTNLSIRRLDQLARKGLRSDRDLERKLTARIDGLANELPSAGQLAEDALKAFHAASTRAVMELTALIESYTAEVKDALAAESSAIGDRLVAAHRREKQDSYTQVESLLALYFDIRPRQALPPAGGWAASADLLLMLYRTVREREPALVLECGSGVSTVIMGYALAQNGNGRLVALEHSEAYLDQTERWLREHELLDQAKVVLSPLAPVTIGDENWSWYSVNDVPQSGIDLIFVDGPPGSTGPSARYPALPLLADRTSPDAIVILDDSDRPDERAIVQRWIDELPGWESKQIGHDKGTAVLTRARP